MRCSWLCSCVSFLSLSSVRPHQRSFLHRTLVKRAVHAFKGGTETTSERRAMKVLGIVFIVFLVAWLPFSILNILSAACRSCGVQTSLLNLTSWLGYISSNLNPVSEHNWPTIISCLVEHCLVSRFSLSLCLSCLVFCSCVDYLHGIQCSISSSVSLDFNLSNDVFLAETHGQECLRIRRVEYTSIHTNRIESTIVSILSTNVA
jgi:7 transmembrane receptor (rhodopsin family)